MNSAQFQRHLQTRSDLTPDDVSRIVDEWVRFFNNHKGAFASLESAESRNMYLSRLEIPFGLITSSELLRCPRCETETQVLTGKDDAGTHILQVFCKCEGFNEGDPNEREKDSAWSDAEILCEVDSCFGEIDLRVKYFDYENGHPRFKKETWRLAVACGDTTRSYWDWLSRKIDIFRDVEEPSFLLDDKMEFFGDEDEEDE